MPKSDSL